MCPQCGGTDMRSVLSETRDDEVGYHEDTYRWVCANCGEISTEEEMEKANAE